MLHHSYLATLWLLRCWQHVAKAIDRIRIGNCVYTHCQTPLLALPLHQLSDCYKCFTFHFVCAASTHFTQ